MHAVLLDVCPLILAMQAVCTRTLQAQKDKAVNVIRHDRTCGIACMCVYYCRIPASVYTSGQQAVTTLVVTGIHCRWKCKLRLEAGDNALRIAIEAAACCVQHEAPKAAYYSHLVQ